MKARSRKESRRMRHDRIRKKVRGTADRPRLSVMISNRHIYVQFIDDDRGVTLASATSRGTEQKHTVAAAGELGTRTLKCAMDAGIKRVVVDRGGHRYHGRVKAIVDPLKQAGLLTGAKEET